MKLNLLALLWVALLHAQSFDVASVKRSPANSDFAFTVDGGKITAHNADVRSLIRAAYRILDFQISGGPNWLASERYDVDAKSDIHSAAPSAGPADAAQTRLMLQALLADRFQLKVRRESKEMAVLALTVAKGSKGKMTPADATGCDLDPAGLNPCGSISFKPGPVMTCKKVTMPLFTAALSALLRQPLKDETGLSGVFDFKLDLGTAGFAPTPESAPSEVDRMNAIMSAMQDQLGLKLEPTRSAVEMLIVEHVERPSAN